MKKSVIKSSLLLGVTVISIMEIYSCQKSTENQQITETEPDMVFATAVAYTNTTTHAETGFESNGRGPFYETTFKRPSYANVMTPSLGAAEGTRALKFNWLQSTWDAGNQTTDRDRKGIEAGSNLRFKKDGWFGCKFMVPNQFPTNRYTIIAQGFNEGAISGCERSWGWIIFIDNNSLKIRYRKSCGQETYEQTIASGVQRDAWKSLIVQWRVSKENRGKIVVWYANDVYSQSSPTFQDTEINMGWGTWSGNNINEKWKIKYGIYASDCTEHVGDGGERTIYFDNVSQWVDDAATNNGFDIVDPT